MTTSFFYLIIIIGLIAVTYLGISETYASQYPVIDPVRAYYDEKNRIAQLEYADGIPIPKQYPSLFITLPDKIVCDNWIPVHGNVPEKGMLFWTIVSNGWVSFANLSHDPQKSLINYFYLPCEETGENGQINVTFMYLDLPNREPYDEVEKASRVSGLTIDRYYLSVQESFKITHD